MGTIWRAKSSQNSRWTPRSALINSQPLCTDVEKEDERWATWVGGTCPMCLVPSLAADPYPFSEIDNIQPTVVRCCVDGLLLTKAISMSLLRNNSIMSCYDMVPGIQLRCYRSRSLIEYPRSRIRSFLLPLTRWSEHFSPARLLNRIASSKRSKTVSEISSRIGSRGGRKERSRIPHRVSFYKSCPRQIAAASLNVRHGREL